jgi:hypothetical protein
MERVSRFKSFREFVGIIQQEGFSYGSKAFQAKLEKKRKEKESNEEQEAEQRNNAARNAFRREGGMISYEKGPDGKVVRGRRTKDGKFTPDT